MAHSHLPLLTARYTKQLPNVRLHPKEPLGNDHKLTACSDDLCLMQAFARLSAVYGGTYMLSKPDVKVLS